MDMTQARAKAGGEVGANGEWYAGGAFIATKDNPKSVPYTPKPVDTARLAADRAETVRLQAWLESRRVAFADVIARLTANPGDVDAARWAWLMENGHAGFLPSLGRDLFMSGSLSRRQAVYVAKAILGRQKRSNEAEWDALLSTLTEQFS